MRLSLPARLFLWTIMGFGFAFIYVPLTLVVSILLIRTLPLLGHQQVLQPHGGARQPPTRAFVMQYLDQSLLLSRRQLLH